MTRSHIKSLLITGALAALAGCSDRGGDPVNPGPGDDPVSFSADVQIIFNDRCIGCHGLAGNGNLDLRAANSYANLAGVDSFGYTGLRVVPGDPDASVLYRKLTGASGVGDRMPSDGVLPAGSIAIIGDWIAEGAMNN